MELSDWFKGFEKGISCLNSEQRASFFSECGKNCVKCGTLQIYQELYKKANGDLDTFFLEADKLPGVRSEIIEKGAVYHLYFMECTCMLHRQGYVSTPLLCECSQQSILYVLHSLWKGKTFRVTISESILRGSQHCKMQIKTTNKSLFPEYPIRQATEQDIPALQELFHNTVLYVNSKDYTQEETADWASCGNSMEHWKELLAKHHFIVALDNQGKIIGFSSMNAEGYMHAMFVHKDRQGKGVATRLLAEAEKMAREYEVQKIWAEVSITARPFFEKHGYRIIKEQKAKANRLYLTNYVMEKTI